MKPIVITINLLLISLLVFSQNEIKNDTIYKLNKEQIICKISHISESEVIFSYPGETLTNAISKKQIEKVHFGNGRVQQFSELIIIKTEEDWKKVHITTLESDVSGLVKKAEVTGKVRGTALSDMTVLKKKAEERIKREAARIGAHMVLIQTYDITDSMPGISSGKVNITGIAYSYK